MYIYILSNCVKTTHIVYKILFSTIFSGRYRYRGTTNRNKNSKMNSKCSSKKEILLRYDIKRTKGVKHLLLCSCYFKYAWWQPQILNTMKFIIVGSKFNEIFQVYVCWIVQIQSFFTWTNMNTRFFEYLEILKASTFVYFGLIYIYIYIF